MEFYRAVTALLIMSVALPTPVWPAPAPAPAPVATPRPVLNNSASKANETQLTMAATNAPLRPMYGKVRVGARIAYGLEHNGNLVLLIIWGHGGNDGIVELQIDNKPPVAGVQANHYRGTPNQGIDAILAAAWAAQTPPVVYTDTLPGVCYSSLRLPPGSSTGSLDVASVWKGRRVYDPRMDSTNGGSGPQRLNDSTTWAWSDTAALCEADFITSTEFGMGEAVNWASAASTATDNEELLGTAPNQVKRRTLNLVLETVQESDLWRQTFNTYAGCWTFLCGGEWVFVSDKPATPVATISHDAGQIRSIGPLEKRGTARQPTVMVVSFTDTSVTPYGKGTAVYPPNATDQTVPSIVDLPGIDNFAAAMREAEERYKKLILNDLSFPLGVFDDGLALELGDVIAVTHPIGLSAKQVRILGHGGGAGKYDLSCVEYDPAVHSNSVEIAPTYPDTDLPSPLNPPAVTGLVVTEVVATMYNGRKGSRFLVSWDATTFPYISGYRVEVLASGQLVDSTPVASPAYASQFVQEGIYYTVKVASLTTIAIGAWTQTAVLAQGKLLKPGDVPFFNAYELGGTLYGFITPGEDLDRTGHEYRRATINGAETIAQHWARGTLVQRVADPSVTLESTNEPVGTWRYMVKCLDSVRSALYPFGQESVNAAYIDVTVTSDARAFWSDSHRFTGHTLTNMIEYADYPPSSGGVDRDKYISSGGVALSTALPNAADTYPNPLATYDAPANSESLSTMYDCGAIVAGQWTAEVDTATCNIVNLTGTAVVSIELSDTGADGTWTAYSGTSAKGSGRFVRVRISTTGVMILTGHPTIRVAVIPYPEEHTVTTSATLPATLTLDRLYLAIVGIPDAKVLGATLIHARCDNIQIASDGTTTVDVYAWDNAGTRVVASAGVRFNGILRT